MKHQFILGAVFLACVTSMAVAAPSTDSLQVKKIAMIKEGIYFYSNIAELNKNPAHTPISNCRGDDSASVMKCSEPLDARARAIVSKWFNLPLGNAEDLKNIGDQIINDVTKVDGDSRKRLHAFGTLKKQISTLVIVAGEKVGPAITEDDSDNAPSEKKSGAAVDAATLHYDTTPWGLYFIAALAILLATAAFYIACRAFKKTPSNTGGFGQGNGEEHEQLQRVKSGIDGLGQSDRVLYEQFNAEVSETLTKMDTEINNVKLSLIENQEKLSKQIRLFLEKNDETFGKIQVESPSEIASHPAGNSQTFYAKFADGNGFDVNLLSKEQDDKMVYELTVADNNTATYRVTANKEAQLLALEDVGVYLRRACDYVGQPKSDSRIMTKEEGKLQLEGSKWRIIKPAIIDFE